MSDRAVFFSELIYCQSCKKAALEYLQKEYGPYVNWGMLNGNECPALFGLSKNMSACGNIHELENKLYGLSKVLCHDLRISMLDDRGEATWIVHPPGTKNPEFPEYDMEFDVISFTTYEALKRHEARKVKE